MTKQQDHSTPATQATTDDIQQLVLLFSRVAGSQLDETKVAEIVRSELAKADTVKHEIFVDDIKKGDIGPHCHPVVSEMVDLLALSIPVYLYGPAGSGKSTAAKQAASALELDFYEYGSILVKFELLGSMALDGSYQRSKFRDWFEHGGLLLLDEMDGSCPRAMVAFNNALRGPAGTMFTFPDGPVSKHEDCRLVAAANTTGNGSTIEYVGRNAIDAATLNGFAPMYMNYNEKVEESLARGHDWWLETCRLAQAKTAELNLKKHIVSPRQIDFGSRLLSGLGDNKANRKRAVKTFIRQTLGDDQWAQLDKAMSTTGWSV